MAIAVLPAAPVGGEALPLPGARRRGAPFHLSRRRRARIEALVASLIALLDLDDGDCDREPETIEEEDREASLQPAVTPDAARATAPLAWWG